MTDELTAMRDRLNALESAIAGHYAAEPARRRLESVARGFVADWQSEAALAARAKDPAAYDAQLRAMGATPLALSLYARQRQAAIELGTFVPEEGTSNE